MNEVVSMVNHAPSVAKEDKVLIKNLSSQLGMSPPVGGASEHQWKQLAEAKSITSMKQPQKRLT
jgi:hypothetical protein